MFASHDTIKKKKERHVVVRLSNLLLMRNMSSVGVDMPCFPLKEQSRDPVQEAIHFRTELRYVHRVLVTKADP
jgi:hypothetical protein